MRVVATPYVCVEKDPGNENSDIGHNQQTLKGATELLIYQHPLGC